MKLQRVLSSQSSFRLGCAIKKPISSNTGSQPWRTIAWKLLDGDDSGRSESQKNKQETATEEEAELFSRQSLGLA
jgi:hypothetical protein